MQTRTQMVLIAAALYFAGTAPARGQDTATDLRWLAFLGCWQSNAATRVCVVPAHGASAVDLVTLVHGQVAARERIAATGERQPRSQDNCTGWESAEWSALGQRVYLRSEYACAGGATRSASGLIAMSGDGQWLHVLGVTVREQTGIRVVRYWEAAADSAPKAGVWAVSEARAIAGAPLATDDVVEASRHVDAPVLEAWLAERGESFAIDAKRLVALADAGVPPRVIDLMVALSYPRAFAINAASRQAERRVGQTATDQTGGAAPIGPIEPYCYAPHSWYSQFAYDCSGLGYGVGEYSPYGFGGYGWYPGGSPVTIVLLNSGGSSKSHGRVVNGRGYSQDGSTGAAQAPARPVFEPTSPSGGRGATSSGTGSASNSGTSSGSTEQRTAKPRPPN